MSLVDTDDSDLVSASLAGNRDAFGQIVARYQSLVCSLAYSATGSLTQSEDLAQETFLTAWKQLRDLREPAKLRSWLCGIARNLAHNSLRRQGREPAHAAESLESLPDSPAPEPQPLAQTITREEEAILWRSLEQIPETYREPLILFYREHQSIESVAAKLELSDDAVKQRLSRGRKLLHEQVLAFVEGTLQRTTPGKAFTLGVIAALPAVFATSASAATLGATAAKGSAVAKTAGAMGIFSALLGPVIGIAGAWVGIRAGIESARSPREREFVIRKTRQIILLILSFMAAILIIVSFSILPGPSHQGTVALLSLALVATYVIALVTYGLRFNREQRRIREEETAAGHDYPGIDFVKLWQTYEYRSPLTFLGLPLLHIRNGRQKGEKLQPAIGWIAIGDLSIGLFSFGGIAFGGISLGGLSCGLVSSGGLALGILSVGGLAIGLWAAAGGLAIGYLAHGGCALAWHIAEGGLAKAFDFAVGGSATAAHANDAAAKLIVNSTTFFQSAEVVMRNAVWLSMLPMILVFRQSARLRRALRERREKN